MRSGIGSDLLCGTSLAAVEEFRSVTPTKERSSRVLKNARSAPDVCLH